MALGLALYIHLVCVCRIVACRHANGSRSCLSLHVQCIYQYTGLSRWIICALVVCGKNCGCPFIVDVMNIKQLTYTALQSDKLGLYIPCVQSKWSISMHGHLLMAFTQSTICKFYKSHVHLKVCMCFLSSSLFAAGQKQSLSLSFTCSVTRNHRWLAA